MAVEAFAVSGGSLVNTVLHTRPEYILLFYALFINGTGLLLPDSSCASTGLVPDTPE